MRKKFDLKIRYNRSRLRLNFAMGILWSLLGVGYILSSNTTFFSYTYMVLGVLYFISFYCDKRYGYTTISNGVIKKRDNPFFNNSLEIKNIENIVKTSEIYFLKTKTARMSIHTTLVSKESMQKLNEVIDAINERIKAQNLTQ
ncbi:hypothetical protein [Gaetbulibacter jejuensis]|uniref:PH (Pleckstrin Homology) domain-containing protein n=1 Tax=Gaetbulibacter jejuensis TaxID=584607 RepID=A0ABN1JGE5_9FLAO